jgi:hypothetical protein
VWNDPLAMNAVDFVRKQLGSAISNFPSGFANDLTPNVNTPIARDGEHTN